MQFHPTNVAGAWIVEPHPHPDERGHFARTFCADEFRSRGCNPRFVQTSVSYNRRRGTVRGLHYQAPPAAEAKLVRCTRGAIQDVIVDLRPDSPTHLAHASVRLDPGGGCGLYVPPGCAHGFQSLEDDTDVDYMISERYAPELARGVRWDDPALGVEWPLPVTVIAPKDLAWPDLPRVSRPVPI